MLNTCRKLILVRLTRRFNRKNGFKRNFRRSKPFLTTKISLRGDFLLFYQRKNVSIVILRRQIASRGRTAVQKAVSEEILEGFYRFVGQIDAFAVVADNNSYFVAKNYRQLGQRLDFGVIFDDQHADFLDYQRNFHHKL